MKKTVLSACGGVVFLLAFSTIIRAQTIYKTDPGFFTSVLESFYLRGGSFEETQLIGPAFGYRFNENYDITLHTEFLSTDIKYLSNRRPKTTLLNLGIIFARTGNLSERLILRSEVSLYKALNFNVEGYADSPDPTLTSALASSSVHLRMPLSGSVSLLPKVGGFVGYGDYTPPLSTPTLRQGFEGFALGPQLGFDASFQLSNSFYLIVAPNIRMYYTTKNEDFHGSLLFNVLLNF